MTPLTKNTSGQKGSFAEYTMSNSSSVDSSTPFNANTSIDHPIIISPRDHYDHKKQKWQLDEMMDIKSVYGILMAALCLMPFEFMAIWNSTFMRNFFEFPSWLLYVFIAWLLALLWTFQSIKIGFWRRLTFMTRRYLTVEKFLTVYL